MTQTPALGRSLGNITRGMVEPRAMRRRPPVRRPMSSSAESSIAASSLAMNPARPKKRSDSPAIPHGARVRRCWPVRLASKAGGPRFRRTRSPWRASRRVRAIRSGRRRCRAISCPTRCGWCGTATTPCACRSRAGPTGRPSMNTTSSPNGSASRRSTRASRARTPTRPRC